MDYSRGLNLIAGRHHGGNRRHGVVASQVESEFYNMIGDELVGLVEAAGLNPDYIARDQVTEAVMDLSGALDPRAFGADPSSGPDVNTAAIQAAINAAGARGGGAIRIAGGAYRIHRLTLPYPEQCLTITAGAELQAVTAFERILTVTGANVSIAGPGTIRCPEIHNGENTRNRSAVIWVEGCLGFRAEGFALRNIPRCGIQLENATNVSIRNIDAQGGFPFRSYDERLTTGHFFLYYDPPAGKSSPGLSISGCRVSDCIQGVAGGNYGDIGTMTGVRIDGNSFRNCWDHAIYFIGDRGLVATGNTMLDCRRPIAFQGIASVITGNTMYATGTSDSRHEQAISMRSARNCVITGNTMLGVGAGIDCSELGAGPPEGNIIADNTLIQTLPSTYLLESIRIRGKGGRANTIADNRILTHTAHDTRGAISLIGTEDAPMRDTVIRGNMITSLGLMPGLFSKHQHGLIVENNVVAFGGRSHSGGHLLKCLYLSATRAATIRQNTLTYQEGGDGVTARGVEIDRSCVGTVLRDNRIRLDAPPRTIPVMDNGVDTLRRGDIVGDASLQGEVSLPAGVTETVVRNVNAHPGCVIHLMPLTAAAAPLGALAIPGEGFFTLRATVSPAYESRERALWRYAVL